MASKQVIASEVIAKAVAEATKVVIQAMAAATVEATKCGRTQDRWTCHETANFQLGGRGQVQ